MRQTINRSRALFSGLLAAALAAGSAAAAPAAPAPGLENPIWSPDGSRVALAGAGGAGVLVLDRRTGTLLAITDAPSSGYALRWSPDGRTLGFKLLLPDPRRARPLQVPVVFDVEARRLRALTGPLARAGVPSFTSDGRVAYTVDGALVLAAADGRTLGRYPLGSYANLAPISPDGERVAYNDDRDAIWLLDLTTGERRQLTSAGGWFDPRWSADGRRLLVAGLGGGLQCIDLASGRSAVIADARDGAFLPDGETIVYAQVAGVPDGRRALPSDLATARCDGTGGRRLTATPDARETSPRPSPDGRLLLYRVDEGPLVLAPLGATLGPARPLGASAAGAIRWQDDEGAVPTPPAPGASPLPAVVIPGVPYMHQVYDTPNDFNGHWACNATSAVMTIAYREILPWWDTTVSVPTSHVSHFGNYVSEIYEWAGHRFDIPSDSPDGVAEYGGYGYITQADWEDTKGHMAEYISYHGLESGVDWSPSWAKLTGEVAAGQPFVMLSSITSAGHYKVVIGHHVDQHTVVFNDPYGDKNAGYMNYNGAGVSYDWPGYNNGYASLNTVHCFIWSRAPEPTTGSVHGAVRDADSGEPLLATVTLDSGASAETGPDGSYRFDGLAPGPYTVTAAAPCHGAASAPAAVEAGGDTVVDLALAVDGSCVGEGGGTIEGLVHDLTGAPVAGAQVTLDGSATVTSDSAGGFRFAGVAAGAHQVAAAADCHEPAAVTVEVTDGQVAAADLGLAAVADCTPQTPADPGAPGLFCSAVAAGQSARGVAVPLLLFAAAVLLAVGRRRCR